MRFVIIFVITFYCLYHHVTGNQQDPSDPSKPFWATRGRRSGGRTAIKADDDILPSKSQDDEDGLPELLDKDIIRRREQATSLLASILNGLSTWDGEVVRKRGDGKPDPNNPFWAARG